MAQRLSIEPRQIIEVHSPATLEKIGEVEIDSPLDVRAAARRAREAFRVWGAMDFKSRAKVLLSARDSLIAHGEELIELICRENGKPRLEALVEITYVCDALTFYSKRARRFLRSHRVTPHLLRNKKVTVHYQPRGVKDPMIVLRDADVERAANAAVWGAFTNSGQVCISVERVYVEDAVADEFTRRVVEKTRALRQGADVGGVEARVDVGAMTFPKQVEIVEDHIDDAKARGAQILTGGRRNPNLSGRYF